jgi:hypothetical protein
MRITFKKVKIMRTTKILTRKLIAIICIASLVIAFSACKKDDVPLKVKIIDIPAEYNGKRGQTHLRNDNYNYGTIGSGWVTITNGEVTMKISDSRGPYISDPPMSLTEKGEYYVRFQIFEEMDSSVSISFNAILSVKSDGKINITKEITTISFKTLEIEDPKINKNKGGV